MLNAILTDDEIVLLDGRCRPSIQRHVDAAKARIAAIVRVKTPRTEHDDGSDITPLWVGQEGSDAEFARKLKDACNG